MKALPCIVCGKELENLMPDLTNQAKNANSFFTPGQYGSTVFDPMDGTFLEVNICDDCLLDAAEKQRVYHGTKKPENVLTLWKSGTA